MVFNYGLSVWTCANAPYASTCKANFVSIGRNNGLARWWFTLVLNMQTSSFFAPQVNGWLFCMHDNTFIIIIILKQTWIRWLAKRSLSRYAGEWINLYIPEANKRFQDFLKTNGIKKSITTMADVQKCWILSIDEVWKQLFGAKLGPSTEAASAQLLSRAQLLLSCCLILLNKIDGPYLYGMIGSDIIPGSLSHMLCATYDDQLMTIYQSCGFYRMKRNCFSDAIFNILIGITRCKNPKPEICSLLVKIGQGSYPAKPLQQVRNQLQPPNYASLLKLTIQCIPYRSTRGEAQLFMMNWAWWRTGS
jgi:hypothetical protein